MKVSSIVLMAFAFFGPVTALRATAGGSSGDVIINEDVYDASPDGSADTTKLEKKRNKRKKNLDPETPDFMDREVEHILIDQVKINIEGHKDFTDMNEEEVAFVSDALIYAFDLAAGKTGYKGVFAAMDYADSAPANERLTEEERRALSVKYLGEDASVEDQRKLYYDYWFGDWYLMFSAHCRLCIDDYWDDDDPRYNGVMKLAHGKRNLAEGVGHSWHMVLEEWEENFCGLMKRAPSRFLRELERCELTVDKLSTKTAAMVVN